MWKINENTQNVRIKCQNMPTESGKKKIIKMRPGS